VLQQDGEPDLDAAELDRIRAHYANLSARGPERYAVADLRLDSVGSEHPAVLAEVRLGGGDRTRFDAYVPSGGSTFIFALSWPSPDRANGKDAFAAMCRSLKLASRPRGPARLGSRLLWAAVLGLGIGVVLHTLRKRTTP
jgi:hypothetical protein